MCEILNDILNADRFIFWLIGIITLLGMISTTFFLLKKPSLKIDGYYFDNIINGINLILDSASGCKEITIEYFSGGKKALPTETKENTDGKLEEIKRFVDYSKFQIPIGLVYNNGEVYYQLIILRYISKLQKKHKTKLFLLKIKCINDNNLSKGSIAQINYYDNSHYKRKITRVRNRCKKMFNI